jgi:hypothetical protein
MVRPLQRGGESSRGTVAAGIWDLTLVHVGYSNKPWKSGGDPITVPILTGFYDATLYAPENNWLPMTEQGRAVCSVGFGAMWAVTP